MEFAMGMTSAYGRTTISVSGEIDGAAYKPFASALSAAADGGDPEIHIEMGGVSLIDDECLKCLVETHETLTGAGRKVQVVQASRVVVDALAAIGEWERFA
jgi:anti-anti-sigma factor